MFAPPLPLELIMIHEPWLASGSLPPLRGKVRMGGRNVAGYPPPLSSPARGEETGGRRNLKRKQGFTTKPEAQNNQGKNQEC